MSDTQILALVAPLVIVQIGLMALALRDLFSEERAVAPWGKGAWAVIIVFVNLVGPVVYFLVARRDAPPPDPNAPAPGYGSPHDPPLIGRRRSD